MLVVLREAPPPLVTSARLEAVGDEWRHGLLPPPVVLGNNATVSGRSFASLFLGDLLLFSRLLVPLFWGNDDSPAAGNVVERRYESEHPRDKDWRCGQPAPHDNLASTLHHTLILVISRPGTVSYNGLNIQEEHDGRRSIN